MYGITQYNFLGKNYLKNQVILFVNGVGGGEEEEGLFLNNSVPA